MHLDHLLQSLDGLPEAATRMTHQGRAQIEEIKSRYLHEVIQLAAASRRKDAEIEKLKAELDDACQVIHEMGGRP